MSGTLTEERSIFGRTTRNDNWRNEVNNKSNEPEIVPANREPPNDLYGQLLLGSVETLISYLPGKRNSKRDLDQERSGLQKEFDEIYSNPQATLQQLNTIHPKWLLHQYKRVHRLRELGGDNQNSSRHTCLKRQIVLIAEDYQNWLNTIAAYSIIHNVAVTISREDIEDANVLDSLPPGTAKFDEQLKWVEEKAPALHVLLQRRASRRAEGIAPCEQFDKDISIYVSPNPYGPIVISPNNTSRATTTHGDANIPDSKDTNDAILAVKDPIKQFALKFGHAVEEVTPPAAEDAWSTPGHLLSLLKEQSRANGLSQIPNSSKHPSPNITRQSSRPQNPPPKATESAHSRKVHPNRDNSTDGEVSSPPSAKVDINDEWNEVTSCQPLLTVRVAGQTLHMDSTKISLAPLDQTSELTDSKSSQP